MTPRSYAHFKNNWSLGEEFFRLAEIFSIDCCFIHLLWNWLYLKACCFMSLKWIGFLLRRNKLFSHLLFWFELWHQISYLPQIYIGCHESIPPLNFVLMASLKEHFVIIAEEWGFTWQNGTERHQEASYSTSATAFVFPLVQSHHSSAAHMSSWRRICAHHSTLPPLLECHIVLLLSQSWRDLWAFHFACRHKTCTPSSLRTWWR